MKYNENWTPQNSPYQNIAASVSAFCEFYDINISNKTIFDELWLHDKLNDFQSIVKFFENRNIECIQLNFALEHLKKMFFPAFLLLKDYKTVLLINESRNTITYLDPEKGWVKEKTDSLFKKSMGSIIFVEPPNSFIESNYKSNVLKDDSRKENLKKGYQIEVIENFLTPEECDLLIKLSKRKFKKSAVLVDNKSVLSETRTSKSAYLTFKNDLFDQIKKKASNLSKIPVTHFESLQITSYDPNQYFGVHTDAFYKKNKEALKNGQRLKTILVYLNDDFQGGSTYFPNIEKKVIPKKGSAVMWNSLDSKGDIDERGKHTGLSVFKGKKYVCNIWIRDREMTNYDEVKPEKIKAL